jgi:acid phosphatase (class A)
MHYSRRLLLAAGLTCCLTLPAIAAVEPYVTAKMLDLTPLLPPPPAAGSPADAADLQAVLDAQAHASDARRALALADTDETITAMFGSVLGADFVADKLPKTSLLFARIGASEDAVVDAAKPVFGRPRPWIAHPEVKANAKPSKSPSYPSGHTTRVAASAIVLSEILPERKRDIWARADEYAQSRVVGGMHYPTDLAAGWSSGTALAVMLFQQPDFKTDFAAARAELRAALGLAAE